MKRFLFATLICVGSGCKNQSPTNNSATRYVDGLHTDVSKANDVTQKSNQIIADQEKQAKEVKDSMDDH